MKKETLYDILLWNEPGAKITLDRKKEIIMKYLPIEEEIVNEVLNGCELELLAMDGKKDEMKELGRKMKKEGLDVEVKSVNRKYNQCFPRCIGYNPIARLQMKKNEKLPFSEWIRLANDVSER